MPYYDESFENRVITGQQICHWNPALTSNFRHPVDLVRTRSFRNAPHHAAKTSSEVLDYQADPYAFFLANTAEKDYHEQLRLRGLPAVASPDRGHAFELRRTSLVGDRSTVTSYWSNGSTKDFTFTNASIVSDKSTLPSTLSEIHNGSVRSDPTVDSVIEKYGQTAYARVAPTAVVFDAAQFLGELREGLPSIMLQSFRPRAKAIQGVGSDYLNVEFGWKPLISDLQNAVKALIEATHTFDSSKMNRRVHRKHSVPTERNAGVATFPSGQIVVLQQNGEFGVPKASMPFAADVTVEKTFSRKLWFEGEFTSFLPLGFDPNDFLQRANQLINLKITPSVLWELAPWSWLIDWSTKIGDTIAANELAANDRLIMHYGYAMEHVVCTTTDSWSNRGPSNPSFRWDGTPARSRVFHSWERKKRIRANPYGFKVGSWGGLSTSQGAILAALGLSQGVRG